MSSGAPEGLATPAPLVAPVVLLSNQNRGLVTIDVGRNRYRNGFVFMTVGRYPLSSVKWILCIDQPDHDLMFATGKQIADQIKHMNFISKMKKENGQTKL